MLTGQECARGTSEPDGECPQAGGSLPHHQKEEWESSGMKNREKEGGGVKGRDREAAPVVRKGYLAEIRLMGCRSH